MDVLRRSMIISLSVLLSACVTPSLAAGTDGHDKAAAHDEPRPYDASADARADVEAALAEAKVDGKMTIVAMGANWCHDSRGLAAQFEKERFTALLDENYHLVYVDVGQKNRNIDIAQGFGVDNIVGTPTVFVIASSGAVLNLDTAPTWRNAASRHEDDIFAYFAEFAQPVVADSAAE